MNREQKSGWLLAVMTALLVAVMIVGMLYVNRQVAASERRDCADRLAEIQVYVETPPSTRTGVNAWKSKVNRYDEVGCKPALSPELRRFPIPPKENR